MKIKSFYLLLFSLGLLLSSCHYNNKAANPDSWTGDYFYEEEPIKANAGYAMVMEWSLSIKKQNDGCKGIVEINGQQTYMKLQAAISGDSNAIAVTFNNLIEGNDDDLRKGDTLFTLLKKTGQLITKWGALEPRLSPAHLKECNCFTASARHL